MPNESLTLKWFYMTFHKSERNQFIMSGRRLVDETIESVTEYFESLYNIKKSSGKLQKQLEQRDHKKYEAQRGSTKNRYNDKMRNMANEHRTSRSCNYRDDCNRDHSYKTSPQMQQVQAEGSAGVYRQILPCPWRQGQAHLRGVLR